MKAGVLSRIGPSTRRRRKGQGIAEYAAVIAFVALLIALVFSTTSGGLYSALSQSCSNLTGQFNRLNSASTTP